MNPKKYLQNWIRGWLPKEPNSKIYQRTNSKIWRIPRIIIALIFLGGFIGGLAGALAPYVGLNQGLGVYLWPIIVSIVVGIVIAAIWIRIKRKEEQQRSVWKLKS